MAAFLRPDADALDGNWLNESGNNTNLFSSLSETSASDSEYIQSPVDPVSEVCRIGLSNPTGVVQEPFTLSYRFNNLGGATLVVSLKQGTTEIAAWEETGSGWITQDRTLTGPQFAAITDFTDLIVELSASGGVPPDPTLPLNLDFTAMGGTLNSKVTFTRASAATYYNSSGVLTSASSGAARFEYNPVNLAARGLLLEEQRTNLQLYSSTFSDASWIKGAGAIVTANSGTGPDGANSAWLFSNSGGSTGIRMFHADLAGVVSGDKITASVFVKRGGGDPCDYVHLNHQVASAGALAWFNMATGAWGTVQDWLGLAVHPPEALPGGWWRLAVTRTHPGGALGVNDFFVGFCDADDNTFMTGGKTALVFGVQFEKGAFPGSYIPTTSAAETRAADNASISGSNFASWWNGTPGTFVLELSSVEVANFHYLNVHQAAAPSANRIVVFAGIYAYIEGSVNFSFGTPVSDVPFKFALALASNDVAACFNGGTVGTDTTATIPTVDRLYLGGREDNNQPILRAHFKRLQYYNLRKSNAELQALTT